MQGRPFFRHCGLESALRSGYLGKGVHFGTGREAGGLQGRLAPLFAVWPPLALLTTSSVVASIALTPLPLRLAAIAGVCILLFDISARLKDFRRVAGVLRYDASLLPRHIIRYRRSWCQRTVMHWAAFAALGQTGRTYVRKQYGRMGYRWFHIFPDKTFTRESPFLKPSFWRSLIGGTPEVRSDLRDPAE
jgi:hypothetical protein